MSCCAPGLEPNAVLGEGPSSEELLLASRALGNGLRQIDLSVPDVHCGACIQTIEQAMAKLDNVESARVNLSTKRLMVRWREDKAPPPVAATLRKLGYASHLFDNDAGEDKTFSELIRALAVAGFAASNIMLMSVSVWSGAEAATRDMFHWISAMIAAPALVYSGRVFFRSAWGALRGGHMNMDVPISLAVTLAFAMSLYETINHGRHAYFDASVSLLFFLLIGRTLDHMMRERARSAVVGLSRLVPRGALIVTETGEREYRPISEIREGTRLILTTGERSPVDARVEEGSSELDCSIVSGESAPQAVHQGSIIRAGMLNLTAPLTLSAIATANESFLADMVRLMEAAEGGRARYRRIADRASQIYSPVVHIIAFLSALGWIVTTGDWYRAIFIAIAVLIITCPCALGLAVPMVQVMAARRLFENGIMVKDGSGLERLADADTIVFDKTGTLTLGQPQLTNSHDVDPEMLAQAALIASYSSHPLAKALAQAAKGIRSKAARFEHFKEVPGCGLVAVSGDATWRLGRREWAAEGNAGAADAPHGGPETVLSLNGRIVAAFRFDDRVRKDAAETVAELKNSGIDIEIISGDRYDAAAELATRLGVPAFTAGALPGEKVTRIATLAQHGHKVLMVGDGLNDAPALAAAHVSMAPATAADIGRNAADFVFLRESLGAVPFAMEVSRQAKTLIRQNFVLAIGYNFLAVPIAVMGYVTPLVAALAMSFSSIIVVANAMRLRVKAAPQKGATALAGLAAIFAGHMLQRSSK
ncbi:cation-translocating P-type ATPase [Paramesorhizobium deserti]|uniref:cation-translocating P-type ATPase n=1 Tax=Paramesorhizobium deserti TaxID=1494590 RepID=UPI0009E6AAA1|nr:cation-translocating P-type ATPase [Paramesorhizobium deserti]